MSSPLINRWGLNSFWHNYWYDDFRQSLQYKQDELFTKLIHIFLFHGINFTYNLFANKYWYNTQFKHLVTKSYFRWITRRPNQFGEVLTYSLRQEQDCLFPMKIWIIKYSKWVVINQYWFQPLKFKRNTKGYENPNHLDILHHKSQVGHSTLRLTKTLFSVQLFQKMFRLNYYKF